MLFNTIIIFTNNTHTGAFTHYNMTVAENQKCLDAGIQPYTMIDFVVTNTAVTNPINAVGNWHIIL